MELLVQRFNLFQDVESYDPILNPVLNRELRRTGGRVLITLGDQDIDLSPSFTIFLATRDPNVWTVLLLLYLLRYKKKCIKSTYLHLHHL